MRALFISILFAVVFSTSVIAGSVDGKITKIRAYQDGSDIRFESRIPNLVFIVKKTDILKVMTRRGDITALAEITKNGLSIEKKILVKLDRVGDGLYIKSDKHNHTMFVSEKELDKVKNDR